MDNLIDTRDSKTSLRPISSKFNDIEEEAVPKTSHSTPSGDDGNTGISKVIQFDLEEVEIVSTAKNYNAFSMLALAVSLMATWESLCSTMGSGLVSGGPVSFVYGFLVSFVGNVLTSISLAEAAAMYPSAGGQYQFVAELSPQSIRACTSWYCGWITVFGWHALTASAPYGAASLTMGLISLSNPTFVPQRWHVSVLYWGITLIALIFNIYGSRILPFIQNLIMTFHVAFFIVIFIIVLAVTPSRNTAAFVFTEFKNSTGWSQDGIAWFLGMLTSCYVMVGYDSATHLSEEISNPSVNVPRAMVGSIVINGVMGFAVLLAVLFSMGSLEAALDANTGFPIIHIFNFITRGNSAAASAMTSTIIISASLATFGLLTTTSRMLWAFARDDAPPFSRWISRLDRKRQVPTISILCSSGVIFLLGLLNIASTTAFSAILSLTVVGLYLSYLMPIVLLLYRRVFTPEQMYVGSLQMKRFGAIINLLSILYLVCTSTFLLFPVSQPVTPENMNYASVVLGGVLVFITVDWIFRARMTYNGPKMMALQGIPIPEQ